MRRKRLALSGCALAIILAAGGCGVNHGHSAADRGVSGAQNAAIGSNATAGSNADRSISGVNTDLSWVLPERLSSSPSAPPWPLYNESLSMNQFPASWHGQDSFNHWRVPPKWMPYIYKHEKWHPTSARDVVTKRNGNLPMTLYITLQGTVFLYPQTVTGTQWPGPQGSIADVPPATIVAEFVPLKPAVLAGIIPVSDGQPATLGYVSKVWQEALHMSASEIEQAIEP